MADSALGILAPEKFLDCVHCGLCLSACPTYVELGTEADSPRGRIYLMRGLHAGDIEPTPDVVGHLDLCLGCRACETACPSGVHYGELIEATRGFIAATHQRPLRERLRLAMVRLFFPHPQRLRALLLPARVLEIMGWLAPLRRRSRLVRMLPKLGWWAPVAVDTPALGKQRKRVALLTGCVQQVLFAAANRATLRVLARNGCGVDAPERQVCCGALYLHSGDRQQARDNARRNIDVFGNAVEAIVVNAAGCGAMLKEYGALLADDPVYAERARQFSAKVRDATEFLAALPMLPPQGRLEARVTYHDACHLAHGQGIREAPRQLLRQIPGLELVELTDADVCCGSAGSYNLTQPEMAQRLGERKAANVCATGATIVAAANPGCVMQIQASLQQQGVAITVRHPIELIDEAYG